MGRIVLEVGIDLRPGEKNPKTEQREADVKQPYSRTQIGGVLCGAHADPTLIDGSP